MDRFELVKSLVNQKFGEVRVLVEDDGVLFCGSDVAKALGYEKPRNAIAAHCPHALKRGIEVQTGFKADNTPAIQVVDMSFIPEGDVYRLIIRSKLKEAEEFEHWLFDEMIPKITQTSAKLESIEYTGSIDGLVYTKNGVPTTTSVMIANKFGRNHKDVLDMIDAKMRSPDTMTAEFSAMHITESHYASKNGRVYRQYELDKQGFSFIALSMTGTQADIFKIQYINAFTKMEEAVANMYKARVIEDVLPQDNSSRQYVYVLKNPLNETVKIGVAHDVQKRISQLQTGAGVELELVYQSMICSNAFSIERDVHAHFDSRRTFGEWFKVSPTEVIDYLDNQKYVLKSEYAKYLSLASINKENP